jgi:hypothetical protein
MSQDPYTDQSSQPQNPYQRGAPQDPYQYGIPQDPYGTSQGPYTTPPPYGYGQQQQSYDYSPPQAQATPLSLEQAIKELPSQYLKVLTNPSAETFAQEMGKASWNIVWAQLIGYAIICAILSYIAWLILPNPFDTIGTSPLHPIISQLIHWVFTLGLTPLIISIFFAGVGIRYLIAKAFRGQGTFLAQGYTNLLFVVPLGILGALVSWIPFISGLVVLGTIVYTIVLHIFSIKAVHRLSGGKAAAVVLIPLAVAFLLVLVLIAIVIGMHMALGPIQ